MMPVAPPFDIGRYSAAVFDLDGTVWLSDTPVPGAADFVDGCRRAGLTITFATNATAISVERLTEMLIDCGLGRAGDGVVTGGSVVAGSLAALGVTEVVAEAPPSMIEAIAAAGVEVHPARGPELPSGWEAPRADRALVMGASRAATFGGVELIGRLASIGHPLYVTSLDPGFPARNRIEPGGGMLIAAARALYDVDPIVMGKPSRQYAAAVRRASRSDGPFVFFGDSQRADIGTAELLGADGVLIAEGGRVATDLPQPHYVTDGLHASIRPLELAQESP
jgi:ribonucleotide monophosphatase NagD (HAD superfamily)